MSLVEGLAPNQEVQNQTDEIPEQYGLRLMYYVEIGKNSGEDFSLKELKALNAARTFLAELEPTEAQNA